MRFGLLMIAVAGLLAGCAAAPPPARDVTKETWYGQAVAQAAQMNREAEDFFKTGKSDQAAARIQEAQPIVDRLLAAPNPTLAAEEAASDLDDLYGRMLLSNRHYAWARLMFQKNQARWKRWKPQTDNTARRLNQAETAIAECDKHIGAP